MEYWLILVLTFVISVVVVFVIILFSSFKSKGKGNIEYIIIQSYLGVKKPVRARGFVTLDDAGTIAIFEMFAAKGRTEIGSFHQKHLLPFEKGYIMFLEQYEIGRYRPYEFQDKTKDELVETFDKDFLGNVVHGKDGKPLISITKQSIGLIQPVSNDDVDFIIRSRDRIKEKLLAKQKKNSLWRMLAVVSIYIFLFLSIFINSYYNYLQSEKITGVIERQSEAEVSKVVTQTIMTVLMNQTVKDVVKSLPTGGGG